MCDQQQEAIVICPLCDCTAFHVDGTWPTKDGEIHRKRICSGCGLWGYITKEIPHKIPANGKSNGLPLTESKHTATLANVSKPAAQFKR